MRHRIYSKPRLTYANVTATLALFLALATSGAYAGTVLVGTKQIRNGSILTQDIRKGAVKTSDIGTSAVRSADIQTGGVQSADIGTGQVQPQDVTMPEPEQLQDGDVASVKAGDSFVLVNTVGGYTKEDPTSVLQVDWIGTAAADFSGCVFQLRVNGAPSLGGGGEVYVPNGGTASVSATALFEGLDAGPHTIEVWARTTTGGGASYPCTVGPAYASIKQTFVVSEQVV